MEIQKIETGIGIGQPIPEGCIINISNPKPKRSHAYNRKCQAFVPTVFGLYYKCEKRTERGNLFCEKHSGKE